VTRFPAPDTPSPFADALRDGRFPVALEITSPRELRPEILLRRARLTDGRAQAIHVIQRSDRLPSLEASLLLADAGFEAVWHVVNRGQARADIESDARRAAAGGLRSALCIRGEGTDKDGPATPRVHEVVALLRDVCPEMRVGVTMNQYGPRDRVLHNLLRKLDAGATLVQTQPVFDASPFEALAAEVRSRAPSAAIVPMLMPCVPADAARRIARRLGVRPSAHGSEAEAWEDFSAKLRALAASPLADGVAILTPRADPPAGFAERLCAAIDEALDR